MFEMSLIADGVLIAACLTTAVYCLVLSRRLKRLSSTDDGIGKQIIKLNATLEETRGAVTEMQGATRAASEELSQDIEAAKRQGSQLQKQIARAMKSGAARRVSERVVPAAAPIAVANAPADAAGPEKAGPRAVDAPDAGRNPDGRAVPDDPVIDFEAVEPVVSVPEDLSDAFEADQGDDEAVAKASAEDEFDADDLAVMAQWRAQVVAELSDMSGAADPAGVGEAEIVTGFATETAANERLDDPDERMGPWPFGDGDTDLQDASQDDAPASGWPGSEDEPDAGDGRRDAAETAGPGQDDHDDAVPAGRRGPTVPAIGDDGWLDGQERAAV